MSLSIGVVLNVYEAVDVLALIQEETYDNLRLMVKDALYLRSDAVCPLQNYNANDRNSKEFSHVPLTTLWIICSKLFVEPVYIGLLSSTTARSSLGCSP